ncbi:MAG TPA: YceH family protein [Candidatus Limnocylindrales bacterium]|nr:YceH family protein [Candidatus Limnocylindrales bacterium]
MDFQLDAVEARALGALMEKEMATPEYYPLSLNALVNACNQKSNREPVVSYDDETAEAALERLRDNGLSTRITGRDVRVPKYGQRFTEKYNLGRREEAVICLLLLRGPQTVGELRGRSDRLYQFDDLEAVEATLSRLSEMGFVTKLARLPGSREARYAHLLSGEVEAAVETEHASTPSPSPGAPSDRERIAALERDVAGLKAAFDEFRQKFE